MFHPPVVIVMYNIPSAITLVWKKLVWLCLLAYYHTPKTERHTSSLHDKKVKIICPSFYEDVLLLIAIEGQPNQ